MVDGRKHWGTMEKDESCSPTVRLNSVFITTTIKAAESRDVAIVDLSGAYLGDKMDNKEEVIMIIRCHLADLMALTAPEV